MSCWKATVCISANILAGLISKYNIVIFPEFVLVTGAIGCLSRSLRLWANKITKRAVDKIYCAVGYIRVRDLPFGLLMKSGTIRALKIREFLDLDRRIQVAHGIVIGHRVLARVRSYYLANRFQVRINQSKSNQ